MSSQASGRQSPREFPWVPSALGVPWVLLVPGVLCNPWALVALGKPLGVPIIIFWVRILGRSSSTPSPSERKSITPRLSCCPYLDWWGSPVIVSVWSQAASTTTCGIYGSARAILTVFLGCLGLVLYGVNHFSWFRLLGFLCPVFSLLHILPSVFRAILVCLLSHGFFQLGTKLMSMPG